jgi:competence protein ComEC
MLRSLRALWLVLVSFSLLANSALAGAANKRLDVYWVDVEGGAATLIVTPAGESILIDTGNPGRRDADRIIQAVAKAGLMQIDHLITTHYHRDHFGGAATLAGAIPIKNVYDNGIFDGIREKPDAEYLNFPAAKRVVLSPGDTIPVKQADGAEKLELRCLCARQKTIARPNGKLDDNVCCGEAVAKPIDLSDNANSIVMLVSLGGFRFFDGGDLTWNVEKELVCPVNLVGKVDVYQVTHHGLDASNNPVLLKTLAPSVAIFNNGVTKGCDPNVFANLKELAGVQQVYQVHKNLRPDGDKNNVPDEFIANIDKECKANTIQLSVDPTGKTYSVSIPSNGHSRTYQTK